MSTSTTTEQDHEIQVAVEHAIGWAPEIDPSRIGVAVHGGVVTLTGQVTSYPQKVAAGKTALRTRSVGAVANDITVHFPGDKPSDAEIVAAARSSLDNTSSVPSALVKVEVRDRFIILTGEVQWNYQREAARKAVTHLTGVHGIDNRITLTKRPVANAAETAAMIRKAITRHAALDASKIHVTASRGTVELTGRVSSWSEKHQAELAAWASPHVDHVHNKITIRV
ncbi:MAG: BON domain-containing protein [Aeromicrobium sp.]